jgi:hypothetical protein
VIDRFLEHYKIDRLTSRLPEGPDISKSLCDPNQKLSSMDRNGRQPALNARINSCSPFVNPILFKYEDSDLRLIMHFLGVSVFSCVSL